MEFLNIKMRKDQAIQKAKMNHIYKIDFVKGFTPTEYIIDQMKKHNTDILIELIRDNLINAIQCKNAFGVDWYQIHLTK
jgi:hypothetical protein